MAIKWPALGGGEKPAQAAKAANPGMRQVRPLPLIGHLPVSRQYTVLGTLLLVLVAIAGVFVVVDYREATYGAGYVSTAADMRMLTQRIAKATQSGLSGNAQAFRQLQESRDQFVAAHHRGERDHQQIADQQSVDRLADDLGVFADVDQQQQHQLAGEEDGRTRRCHNAGRQRDVEDAGEIGLDEVHHAERAEECADAEPMPRTKQRRQHREIEQRVTAKQQQVLDFRHVATTAPGTPAICRRTPSRRQV